MSIVHLHAAGDDIGAEFHVVAVPPDANAEPVRTFQSFTGDIQRMSDWLKTCHVTTIAMESKRWAYLSVVLDLFARKPEGWAMAFSPNSRLTMKALEMAWETRGKPVGVMFHSDSSHYTSRQLLLRYWKTGE